MFNLTTYGRDPTATPVSNLWPHQAEEFRDWTTTILIQPCSLLPSRCTVVRCRAVLRGDFKVFSVFHKHTFVSTQACTHALLPETQVTTRLSSCRWSMSKSVHRQSGSTTLEPIVWLQYCCQTSRSTLNEVLRIRVAGVPLSKHLRLVKFWLTLCRAE